MNPAERWRRVESLYHAARQRASEERAAFLAEACAGDAELRREVESLLAQPVSADGMLERPALAAAGATRSDARRSSLTGRRLGVYQVLAPLGAGGMGEVYRARDTKLGREVAIKVLPPALTTDAERVARFEREARVLAALNHPNIATIYGFEELDGIHTLVLELVDGETLAERRPMPVIEALGIARQIVDALDIAHEKGIIHRDLKPANIMITPDGVVKVLDFGLARLARLEHVEVAESASPTNTLNATREGLIVGTAAYMSPEQARGHAVDKRTDIWGFGCVLYEMVTGRAAFARETITDTLAAILESRPEWDALPADTPTALRRLLRRCLEKNPKHRLRDLGDARIELEEGLTPDINARASVAGVDSRRRALTWALLGAAVIAIASLGWIWMLSRSASESTSPIVTRSTITLPPNHELDTGGGAGPLAIAPDGRSLAYVAHSLGRTQLYRRSLDAFEAKPIAGTESAQYPFFSPDGESVAFFADRKLKRVSIHGGAPVTICEAPVGGRGGSWAPDGTIVFDPGDSGLMRVAAAGGRPEPLRTADATMDASNLSWPQFLPGGRAVVATAGLEGAATSILAVLSLDTGEWRRLGPGSQAQYLASGHLVYHAPGVREGELHAVAFDAETLTTRGTPVLVLDSIFRAQDRGAAYFAVAQNGTLIFTPGGYARTLVRVDRNGRRTPLLDDRRGFRGPEISPDGRSVAITVDPRPSQVWVYDLVRRSGIPLATNGHNLAPLWTPDGRRVTYSSQGDMFLRAADGGTAAKRLLARERPQYATSWTRDGRLLVFNETQPASDNYDIWVLPMDGQPRPLIATPDNDAHGRLSPDERWIAYHSNESGKLEVYVRPFPNVSDGKWTISTAGGQQAMWSPSGRELFYVVGSAMMAVSVETRDGVFSAGTPEVLFTGPFDTSYTQYAVSNDGSHFIMVEVDPNARPTQVQVVLNWAEELKRMAAPRP